MKHLSIWKAKRTKRNTPQEELFKAIDSNNADKATWAIKMGANVELKNWDKRTPLESVKHLEVLKALVAGGVDLSSQDHLKKTILHRAILLRNPRIIKYLLTQDIDFNACDKYGRTALHYAVEHNSSNNIIKELLKVCDLMPTDFKSRTPLHLAIEKGKLNNVKLLVKAYQEKGQSDHLLARSLLTLAVRQNKIQVFRELCKVFQWKKDENLWSLLHHAAACNVVDIVKELATYENIRVNDRDYRGRTAMHIAVEHDSIETVQFLLRLENGVAVALNELRNPELPPSVIAIIIEMAGCNLNLSLKDIDGHTARMCSRSMKMDEIFIVHYLNRPKKFKEFIID